MPLYRDCRNCGNAKEPDRYSEFLCLSCQAASDEAAEFASREGQDVGTARRTALSRLAPGSMSHKHPGMLFDKIDTTRLSAREQAVHGSETDPRRLRG